MNDARNRQSLQGKRSAELTEPELKSGENTERDIWESAGILSARHGDLAAIEASKMADHYLEIGDIDMQQSWLRVMRAIVDIDNVDGKVAN